MQIAELSGKGKTIVCIKRISVLTIIIGSMMIQMTALNSNTILGSDTAVYLNLAMSLSQGKGYVETWSSDRKPHRKFPILFSLMLVPQVRMFGIDFLWLKTIMLWAGICALLIFYQLLESQREEHIIPIMLLVGASAYLAIYAGTILSEIPYLLLSLLGIWGVVRYRAVPRWNHWAGLTSAFFIVAAYLTRTIGVSLMVASIISLIADSKKSIGLKKSLFHGLLFISTVVIWTLKSDAQGGGYLKYFMMDKMAMQPASIQLSARYIINNIYALIFYIFPGVISGIQFESRVLLALSLTLVLICGYLRDIRSKGSIVSWYVSLYLIILTVWPWVSISGQRFIVPLIPFLYWYFYHGILELLTHVKVMKKELVAAIVSVTIAAVNVFSPLRWIESEYQQENISKADVVSFEKLSNWLRYNTHESELLLTFGGGAQLYLLSHRRSVHDDGLEKDDQNLVQLLETDANYVVFDNIFARERLKNEFTEKIACINESGFYELVYNRHGNYVFKRLSNDGNEAYKALQL